MNDIANIGFQLPKELQEKSSATQVSETRALAEIQAACIMAKRDPRNEHACYGAIIESCKRPFLAEAALYAYPRGNSLVTGPSIRLAEVLAQRWKNMRVGVTITHQTAEKTEARAYAYDLETNYMVDQEFVVPHKRTTKKGTTILTDERDIRELVANISSRHLRGCILRVIPGDVVEAAIEQCKKTMTDDHKEPISDSIRKLVLAFDEYGIKVEHLEKRLGHKLDATIATELVTLRSIFKSLRDGMATREDFFDFGIAQQAGQATERLQNLITPALQEANEADISNNSNAYNDAKYVLQNAKTLDELHVAADLIREIKDKTLHAELTGIYKARQAGFKDK